MALSAHPALFTRLPKLYAAVVFLYYTALVLLHPHAPLLGDLSRWIYLGQVTARHLSGQPDPAHFFFHYPVPNSTHAVVLGLLCTVVSWSLAARIYLVLFFAISYAAVASLSRSADTSPLIWYIAPTGFFLGVNFWYGFLAFQLGIALLFFFTSALLLRYERGSEPRLADWPLGLLLVLLYFTHMVPFAFACLMLAVFAGQTRSLRVLWQLALPFLLLLWYVAGRIVTGPLVGSYVGTTRPDLLNLAFWLYKFNTYLKSFGFINPIFGDGRHSVALALEGTAPFLLLFCVNLVVCGALLILYARNVRKGSPLRQISFVWVAAAIALSIYAVVPREMLGISDPGSRILQTVAWLCLFFCLPRSRTASAEAYTAAAGSVVLALAGAALFATVPWRIYPHARRTLPAPFEELANAPSDYAGADLLALAQGIYDNAVFPTSIMGNRKW